MPLTQGDSSAASEDPDVLPEEALRYGDLRYWTAPASSGTQAYDPDMM